MIVFTVTVNDNGTPDDNPKGQRELRGCPHLASAPSARTFPPPPSTLNPRASRSCRDRVSSRGAGCNR